MKITVDVWRQSGPESSGAFDTYQIDDATVEMSLLELLDRLNDQLVESGNEPIAFDSDCEKGSAVLWHHRRRRSPWAGCEHSHVPSAPAQLLRR